MLHFHTDWWYHVFIINHILLSMPLSKLFFTVDTFLYFYELAPNSICCFLCPFRCWPVTNHYSWKAGVGKHLCHFPMSYWIQLVKAIIAKMKWANECNVFATRMSTYLCSINVTCCQHYMYLPLNWGSAGPRIEKLFTDSPHSGDPHSRKTSMPKTTCLSTSLLHSNLETFHSRQLTLF